MVLKEMFNFARYVMICMLYTCFVYRVQRKRAIVCVNNKKKNNKKYPASCFQITFEIE